MRREGRVSGETFPNTKMTVKIAALSIIVNRDVQKSLLEHRQPSSDTSSKQSSKVYWSGSNSSCLKLLPQLS